MSTDENSTSGNGGVLPKRSLPSQRDDEPPSRTVARTVADSLGVEPRSLPPLNDVIDPDAFDTLVRRCRWQNGGWPAISFTYADRAVDVTGSDDVSVLPADRAGFERRAGSVDWPHVSPPDVSHPVDSLETRLPLAVAVQTGDGRARVRDEIDEVIDREAIGRLNRRRSNGVERIGGFVRFSILGCDVVVDPDGTVATGSTLERLELTGCNVLLVGAVPDAVSDRASARLLGTADGSRDRIVGLLDRSTETAFGRLSRAGRSDRPARVIQHGTVARSTAGASSSAGPSALEGVPAPRVEHVDGDLESTLAAVEAAIEDAEDASDLRLCLDSLRPLLERYDGDRSRSLLEPVCRSVRNRGGVGHYVLPVDRTADRVAELESLFDATVELDVDGTEPVQRWHLNASDHVTDWFAC
ncbi:DUF7504 family protein [Natrarchaeobius oligotrophus]|uniref:Halobacterial output domain-containing protein n=1 Tax=Natrarchaeobius chitinivorans TaxID=1679083 RepID=A0A3N6MRF4_NATCH|nr:HalOD1 output domain-containing protein [Natrarchaeobius chitinivorans]RQG98851.1 hypothetical protein EA472_16690 [Natrarchaeobius chitinivorans]